LTVCENAAVEPLDNVQRDPLNRVRIHIARWSRRHEHTLKPENGRRSRVCDWPRISHGSVVDSMQAGITCGRSGFASLRRRPYPAAQSEITDTNLLKSHCFGAIRVAQTSLHLHVRGHQRTDTRQPRMCPAC